MINAYIAKKKINKDIYQIRKNNTYPFQVIITQKNILIMGRNISTDSDNHYSDLVLAIFKFDGYWYSLDHFNSSNTLLIKISAYEYIHVGSSIYSFVTHDIIIRYISPIDDVIKFTVALAHNTAYLLCDFVYLKLKQQRFSNDAIEIYNQFHSRSYEKEKCTVKKMIAWY